MANKKGTGLLMVWVDVPADKEEEFNRWYNEEHLQELLSIPGVLNATRYEAVRSGPKHLACYELESPAVVESAAFGVGATHRPPGYRHQLHQQRLRDDSSQGTNPANRSGRYGPGPANWPHGCCAGARGRMEPVVQRGLRTQLRKSARVHPGPPLAGSKRRSPICSGL